jgi:hypothetical protein
VHLWDSDVITGRWRIQSDGLVNVEFLTPTARGVPRYSRLKMRVENLSDDKGTGKIRFGAKLTWDGFRTVDYRTGEESLFVIRDINPLFSGKMQIVD